MATNLIDDFRVKNRIYGQYGAYFAKGASDVSIDTAGKILSAGQDLYSIFAGALSGGAPLTFSTNLTATNASYDSGTPVTVGVSFTPTFGTVNASSFVGSLAGNASTATKWAAPITITLSGDVAGSVTFDGSTNVGTTTLAIQPNSVELGTDTTGDYVATVTVNRGLSSSGTGEGAAVEIGHNTFGGASIASTNSNGIVIQSLGTTIDAFGHVTATSVGTIDLDGRYYTETEIDNKLANSPKWDSAYTTINAQSAANASVYSSYNTQSAALFNSASSPSQGTVRLLTQNLVTFDVDTGLQTSDSPQFAGLTVAGNTTVTGNLSVLGDIVYIDTTVTTTSALSVINSGTGPALYVRQTGVEPIATFVDKEGGSIVFADTGAVGIGTAAPGEKLSVVGNISASGSITVGGTATVGTIATGSGDSVVTEESGTLKKRTVDSRVWGSTLVDNGSVNLTANAVPKATDANTLANSNITDSGTLITLGSNTSVTGTLSTNNAVSTTGVVVENGTKDLNKKLFVSTVASTGTAVTTFAVANLAAVKYTVVLINGNNRTAFEVIATVETAGNNTKGTVYAIVDNQAQTQLVDVDVSVSGSDYILTITSFADNTTALIEGTAFYNA